MHGAVRVEVARHAANCAGLPSHNQVHLCHVLHKFDGHSVSHFPGRHAQYRLGCRSQISSEQNCEFPQ